MLLSDASDADLAERAARGDEPAFTALMRRYKDRLYRLVRRHVGDAEEAYDVVQDSFIAAWGAMARYDPSRSFWVWLARIALNKCRDRGRRLFVRRLIRGTASLDAAGDIPDNTPSPETIVGDRQAVARLDREIVALPTILKEALILTALDGLSQSEAAEVLGVSTKAIETRVSRARARLAGRLG